MTVPAQARSLFSQTFLPFTVFFQTIFVSLHYSKYNLIKI